MYSKVLNYFETSSGKTTAIAFTLLSSCVLPLVLFVLRFEAVFKQYLPSIYDLTVSILFAVDLAALRRRS